MTSIGFVGLGSMGVPVAGRLPDPPEHAWFDMQFMHKDIRLAQEAARESGVPLPAATAAC
jgi:3-hydroxyisobutyrate dehydrogenase-like beta-hydroxyacid dehydrogenase